MEGWLLLQQVPLGQLPHDSPPASYFSPIFLHAQCHGHGLWHATLSLPQFIIYPPKLKLGATSAAAGSYACRFMHATTHAYVTFLLVNRRCLNSLCLPASPDTLFDT